MVQGAVDVLWLKFLHALGAMVLFGTGLGTAFQFWLAHRSRDPRAIAVVARNAVLADWVFTTPADRVAAEIPRDAPRAETAGLAVAVPHGLHTAPAGAGIRLVR